MKYSFIILCNTLYFSSRLSFCIVNVLLHVNVPVQGKSSCYCSSRLEAANGLEDIRGNGISK